MKLRKGTGTMIQLDLDWSNGMSWNYWLAYHQDKLLSRGDLCRSGPEGYKLSEQGEERVLDAMMKFTENPGLMLLIEQWYAERFHVLGPLSKELAGDKEKPVY